MVIRKLEAFEFSVLKDLLYEAIYQGDNTEIIPRAIIESPEISIYIDDFGSKEADYCLVADVNGRIVGAVWVRILAGTIKGFGNIDDHMPEFAISLYKEYRNKGIGMALMKRMIQLLKNENYSQASLSVNKSNYAVRLYKSLGFIVIEERDDDYLMVLKLM